MRTSMHHVSWRDVRLLKSKVGLVERCFQLSCTAGELEEVRAAIQLMGGTRLSKKRVDSRKQHKYRDAPTTAVAKRPAAKRPSANLSDSTAPSGRKFCSVSLAGVWHHSYDNIAKVECIGALFCFIYTLYITLYIYIETYSLSCQDHTFVM